VPGGRGDTPAARLSVVRQKWSLTLANVISRNEAMGFRTRVVRCSGAVLASLALCAPLARAQETSTEYRVIPLTAGIHVIRAEVAMAPTERAKGLMFRPALGPNQGMVFLFDEPAVQCMWMRNTLIPLSVAFIADDGHVLNIEDMVPQSEDNHCAAKPARYALEMNKGWFTKHGILVGAKISGLPRAVQ
jgi:hypothetical protein